MDVSARKIPNSRNKQGMRGKRKKQSKKTNKLQGLIKIAFVIFLVYLVISFVSGFSKAHSLKKDITSLRTEVKSLEKVNYQLQKEVKYFKSPEAIEKLAREKLGLVKKGEVVVMPSCEVED